MSNELAKPRELGKVIREKREAKGLGLNQLATLADMPASALSRLEHGTRKKINVEYLRRIAPRIGVTYEFLLWKAGYIESPEKANEPIQEDEEITILSSRWKELTAEEKEAVMRVVQAFLQEK